MTNLTPAVYDAALRFLLWLNRKTADLGVAIGLARRALYDPSLKTLPVLDRISIELGRVRGKTGTGWAAEFTQ